MAAADESPGGVLHGVLHLQGDAVGAHGLHLNRGAQEEGLRTDRLGQGRSRLYALLACLHQDEQRCEARACAVWHMLSQVSYMM